MAAASPWHVEWGTEPQMVDPMSVQSMFLVSQEITCLGEVGLEFQQSMDQSAIFSNDKTRLKIPLSKCSKNIHYNKQLKSPPNSFLGQFDKNKGTNVFPYLSPDASHHKILHAIPQVWTQNHKKCVKMLKSWHNTPQTVEHMHTQLQSIHSPPAPPKKKQQTNKQTEQKNI